MGGSIFGKYMNSTILKSDCDIIVPICDDDALLSDYLDNLNIFYSKHPNEVWGYSHVKLYNPNIENYLDSNKTAKKYNWDLNRVNLNLYTTPINPTYKIDFSQVTYRKIDMIDGEIKYLFPRTENLDADIFTKMFNKYGFCKFTGCYGQYKCWNEDQLSSRISSGISFYFNNSKIKNTKNTKNGKSKI